MSVVHTKDLPAGVAPYRAEFDFERDFDEDGAKKPSSKGKKLPVKSIEDFDKGVWMSAASYASLNAYRKKIAARYRECRDGE